MKKSGKALLLTFALLSAAVLCGCGPAAPEVNFPDPNLEAAVREAIGKPNGSISFIELEKLTELNIPHECWGEGDHSTKIRNISGIEYCVNLKTLNLACNAVSSDISPLSGLTNLEALNLEGNQVDNISPLSGLINLRWLNLEGNDITDTYPISSLTKLEKLEIGQNWIEDISSLASLTSLTELDLAWNYMIENVSSLSSLTNLTVLNLGWNSVSDLSPLSQLPNLERLYLDCNPINISTLSGLSSLTELALRGESSVSSISCGIYIDDIAPLRSLTNLKKLDITDNGVTNLSPLKDLANLEELHLARNPIDNVSAISSLVSLRVLSLGGSALFLGPKVQIDTSHLSELVNLEELHLSDCGIKDIQPLADLIHLKELDLSWNDITDIKPLVDNEGLGMGDIVYLLENPLSKVSTDTYIPELEARGVNIDPRIWRLGE